MIIIIIFVTLTVDVLHYRSIYYITGRLLHYPSSYYITGRLLHYRSIYYITGRLLNYWSIITLQVVTIDFHSFCSKPVFIWIRDKVCSWGRFCGLFVHQHKLTASLAASILLGGQQQHHRRYVYEISRLVRCET